MELWKHRIVNGILKEGITDEPEEAARRLACDVEIAVDRERATRDDLWPCLWTLAAVLERQFAGTVFINCGRADPLPGPVPLGARCVFARGPTPAVLKIGVGIEVPGSPIWGDARGASIGYSALASSCNPAHPIAGFALAGYLGFAALAAAVGVPPHRVEWTTTSIHLPFDPTKHRTLPRDLTVIGLGQLGQAYLALLYFLTAGKECPRLLLIDRDNFGLENRSTQLLLDESEGWCGVPKARHLERLLRDLGWDATGEVRELGWGWKKEAQRPAIAMLGLDNFEARRIAIAAGFAWIVEAGVGTSLTAPRISWHSLPPDNGLAQRIFRETSQTAPLRRDTVLAKRLRQTPGECGWITYQGISASAPSLGVVAGAYAWAEMMRFVAGEHVPIQGRAGLWSPLLPWLRNADSPTVGAAK